MIRGWILLSTLTLSVIFKLWPDYGGDVGFPFSSKILNTQSWVYYFMEHLIAVGVAACFLIEDNTPKWIFGVFFTMMALDFLHYILFFRDEGPGWNVVKVLFLGIPLIYMEVREIWKHFNQ